MLFAVTYHFVVFYQGSTSQSERTPRSYYTNNA